MGNWKMMPLAALLLGSVGAALPAAAAQPERPQPAAMAQEEPSRIKADKPLVMLVCRETRRQGRSAETRAAELTCSTRWAGF